MKQLRFSYRDIIDSFITAFYSELGVTDRCETIMNYFSRIFNGTDEIAKEKLIMAIEPEVTEDELEKIKILLTIIINNITTISVTDLDKYIMDLSSIIIDETFFPLDARMINIEIARTVIENPQYENEYRYFIETVSTTSYRDELINIFGIIFNPPILLTSDFISENIQFLINEIDLMVDPRSKIDFINNYFIQKTEWCGEYEYNWPHTGVRNGLNPSLDVYNYLKDTNQPFNPSFEMLSKELINLLLNHSFTNDPLVGILKS